MENKKRVFAFGCSMVRYCWPTWADIIGHTLSKQGYDYYNFAIPGSGNQAILSSMIKARHEFGITSDDMILVGWSSWTREDRYLPLSENVDDGLYWSVEGTVFNSKLYGSAEFLSKYWSLENDIIKNITAIVAAREIFDIDFESSIPISESDNPPDTGDELLRQFNNTRMPSTYLPLNEIVSAAEHPIYRYDGHPAPSIGLWYASETVAPKLGISIHADTVRWAVKFDSFMKDMCKKTDGFVDDQGNPLTTSWKNANAWRSIDNLWSIRLGEIIKQCEKECARFRNEYGPQQLWASSDISNYLDSFMRSLYY